VLKNEASGEETISIVKSIEAARRSPDSHAIQEGQRVTGAGAIHLRPPVPADGPQVTALIADCPPLDINSAYCNLLQCTHFANTCVLAERDRSVMGWISAYRPPSAPEQIFVWQVAVSPEARGLGLARRMLDHLIELPAARDAQALITTITEDNAASWALFQSFADAHGATLTRAPLFEQETHFAGRHETEYQATIGPLKR
jgi:L-2,4-diaminobutyric acid acetyltransferase